MSPPDPVTIAVAIPVNNAALKPRLALVLQVALSTARFSSVRWHFLLAAARYRSIVATKRVAGSGIGVVRPARLGRTPKVTIFLTSSNNRFPLELTFRTMLAQTRYRPFRLVVADNGSTDGSVEWLNSLTDRFPLEVLHGPRPQSEWYDMMFRQTETEYWVALHEDLIFTGRDWLGDLIARMEADPDLQLLEGEYFAPKPGMAEPVSGEVIDLGESLASWLFCVRSSLRDRLPDASFAFYKGPEPSAVEHRHCYDLGGKLLCDMRAAGLKYGWMPRWYRAKWHHVENLSWAREHRGDGLHAQMKRYQRRDIERRVDKLTTRRPTLRGSVALPLHAPRDTWPGNGRVSQDEPDVAPLGGEESRTVLRSLD
jgi:glycosyltransferase involved in cell wall biosynthesis